MKDLNSKNLRQYIIKYNAQSSIGASTLRNQVKAGGISFCRDFCSKIDFDEFLYGLQGDYDSYLNDRTKMLLNAAEPFNLKWGSARKILNIFHRRLSMDAYLMSENFDKNLLHKLELPIDSKSAKGVYSDSKLPKNRWKSIIALTKNEHELLQKLAKSIANKKKVPLVFLDFKYWTD